MSMAQEDMDASFVQRLEEISAKFGSHMRLAAAAGIPNGTLHGYFTGSEPSRTALVALARAADVSVHWLATGEGPKAASIAPEGYIELPCFNLSGVGPYVDGMIGDPTGRRLFKKDDFPNDFPERVNKLGLLVAAVEGCPELSFEPAIRGGDIFIFQQIRWMIRTPTAFNLFSISSNRPDDIYLIADNGNLRLRKFRRGEGSISMREFRRKLQISSDLSPNAPPWPAGSISISVLTPNDTVERTLTDDDAPGRFHLFGKVIWRSGMLPDIPIVEE
jgi:hypothetical protein